LRQNFAFNIVLEDIMEIGKLIKGLEILDIKGNMDTEIRGIALDSRKVKSGYVFVCIKGYKSDGHNFISSAIENGAGALIVEDEIGAIDGVPIIRVADTRFALAYVSDRYFDHPSAKLRLIGATGTKGKTTTTYMIKSIFEAFHQKVGLIGTISNMIGDEVIYTERTTPESYDLQSLFAEMVEKKVDTAAMEVSSQGLKLNRVACCDFNLGIFTNFSRDHIGPNEHSDFDDYFNSKMKLFKMCKTALVNIDDDSGQRIADACDCEIYTYSIDKVSDFCAKNIIEYSDSVEFDVFCKWGHEHIKTAVPGIFSVYNSLAAIGAGLISGVPFEFIVKGLASIRVPGRAEIVKTDRDFTVMIDYAHSPNSLLNILTTVKGFAKGSVICLFGCGGDRDRAKRPLMAEISAKLADFTIITSDNPRTEEPEKIVKEIEDGIKGTGAKYIAIVDRYSAIKYALDNAKPGDIIVLAGKGHETYQTFKDKTIHFDEREVVTEILADENTSDKMQ
jgi:UDP-N-acetylmuramoyl-L-alanyl-D-glutamate--2,6-diaminopimelate ligase